MNSLFLLNQGNEVELILTKGTNSGISEGEFWYRLFFSVRSVNVNIEYSDEVLLTSELKQIINDEEFINLEENVEFKKSKYSRYLCIKFYPSNDWYSVRLSKYNYNLLKEYISKVLEIKV